MTNRYKMNQKVFQKEYTKWFKELLSKGP